MKKKTRNPIPEQEPLADIDSGRFWFTLVGLLMFKSGHTQAVITKKDVDDFERMHHGETVVYREKGDAIILDLMPELEANKLREEYEAELTLRRMDS